MDSSLLRKAEASHRIASSSDAFETPNVCEGVKPFRVKVITVIECSVAYRMAIIASRRNIELEQSQRTSSLPLKEGEIECSVASVPWNNVIVIINVDPLISMS